MRPAAEPVSSSPSGRPSARSSEGTSAWSAQASGSSTPTAITAPGSAYPIEASWAATRTVAVPCSRPA